MCLQVYKYFQDSTSMSSNSCHMQNQATIYSRLVNSPAIKNELSASRTEVEKIEDKLQLTVLPISAENAGLLPIRGGMIFLCFIVFPCHDCVISELDNYGTFYLVFLCFTVCALYIVVMPCLLLIYVCQIHA